MVKRRHDFERALLDPLYLLAAQTEKKEKNYQKKN